MTISERLSPRVGVSVGSEQEDEQESDMFIRADNPTGVIFL
jgi:hypothetical protein